MPGNIHTHPSKVSGNSKSFVGLGAGWFEMTMVLLKGRKLDLNFQGGQRIQSNKPYVGGVWDFS